MDSDSWTACLSSLPKRYQLAFQSRPELFMDSEENDRNDDVREEFPCPFCSEYFDIVGLCCHIDDEHPVEAKNGICPICAMRAGMDMVAHITLHHGKIFKISFLLDLLQKLGKGVSRSTLSLLRRELQEGTLQSLFGESSCIGNSTSASPDPLLSSFILPMSDGFTSTPSQDLSKTSSAKTISDVKITESRKVLSTPLSLKDQEEMDRRCEFVHGMLLSTMLNYQ
ncbi:hypothetical protein SAY86_016569 [Trapa natans]|uniref:Uncharacterized protein n=1 Tax=Trapa natans TaxID=22666 RepID=A0AAN7LLU5_TRANT|nr:hypothetical protein SAY86_016569 [Trapa natans]